MKNLITLFLVFVILPSHGMILKWNINKDVDYTLKPFSDEYSLQEKDSNSAKMKLTVYEYMMDFKAMKQLIKSINPSHEIVAFENEKGEHSKASCITAELPTVVNRFSNLTHLMLNDARFKDFSDFEKLENLIVLECKKNNDLKSIDGLLRLTKLRKLVIAKCWHVTELDTYRKLLPRSIEYLEVSNCSLTLWKGIEELKKLKTFIAPGNLRLYDNRDLKEVSIDFNSMPYAGAMEVLDLSHNAIKEISLYGCQRCKEIKLNNTYLKEMPSGLDDLIIKGKLEKIDLAYTNISLKKLNQFLVDIKNKDENLLKHSAVVCLVNLLSDYMQYDTKKLIEKRDKIDNTLREFEETKKTFSISDR